MLGSKHLFATVRVTNLENSKRWYQDVLGLSPSSTQVPPGHLAYDTGGGTMLLIYEGGAPKSDHTLAGFEVNNIDATAADLRAKGVKFEDYDFPGLKTVNGICTLGNWKGGWFKDPDGNILAVGQLS